MSRQLAAPVDSPLFVVFANPAVVVVDKPAGWLSVPSRMGADDARPCVGPQLEKQLGERLWPVHRLDEEVSGLLLFARSADAHRRLCHGFESHSVEKSYLALCEGEPPDDAPLGESVRFATTLLRGKKRAYVHPQGKSAITDVKLLSREDKALRFALKPRTGRSHQLRVELARRGCPIVGDTLYGATTKFSDEGIALRAMTLDFTHFADAETLELPPRIEAAPRF